MSLADIKAAYAKSAACPEQDHGADPLPQWEDVPINLRMAIITVYHAGVYKGAMEEITRSRDAFLAKIDSISKGA